MEKRQNRFLIEMELGEDEIESIKEKENIIEE